MSLRSIVVHSISVHVDLNGLQFARITHNNVRAIKGLLYFLCKLRGAGCVESQTATNCIIENAFARRKAVSHESKPQPKITQNTQ